MKVHHTKQEMEYLGSDPDFLAMGQGMYCGYLGRSLMDMGAYLSQSPLLTVLGSAVHFHGGQIQ